MAPSYSSLYAIPPLFFSVFFNISEIDWLSVIYVIKRTG